MQSANQFDAFAQKMADHKLPAVVVRNFQRYYNMLVEGRTGYISSSSLADVSDLPTSSELPPLTGEAIGAIKKTVMIKLNGGLGTGMGMTRAKSLLPLKHGRNFLDLIAQQILAMRERYDCEIPLILMNSFHTRMDSLLALRQYKNLSGPFAPDFLQHKIPRIQVDDLTPVFRPHQPHAEWCPPGHGDIYLALRSSGLLRTLLDRGVEYAFISNCDNLGATLDLHILEWFARKQIPFLMEVADRTASDRKGGHLARLKNGRFTLREQAQCPPEEADDFQDTQRHCYFNTNNVWVNLRALDRLLRASSDCLPLPMIRNKKSFESHNASTTSFYQLETAMGSAISLFDNAHALRVDRTRFIPVKTTNDLLCVSSDRYQLTDDFHVAPAAHGSEKDIFVDLDPNWYKNIDQFTQRFPYGSPSLKNCTQLRVSGDVRFGRHIVVKGEFSIKNTGNAPRYLADGTVLHASA